MEYIPGVWWPSECPKQCLECVRLVPLPVKCTSVSHEDQLQSLMPLRSPNGWLATAITLPCLACRPLNLRSDHPHREIHEGGSWGRFNWSYHGQNVRCFSATLSIHVRWVKNRQIDPLRASHNVNTVPKLLKRLAVLRQSPAALLITACRYQPFFWIPKSAHTKPKLLKSSSKQLWLMC